MDYDKNITNDNVYTVYMHVCPNGKKYIGCTGQKLILRFGKTGNKYKSNKRFYEDIQNFGWDNIEHNIIQSEMSKIDGYALEKELISKYNTISQEYGYNIGNGGLDENVFAGKPKDELNLGEKNHMSKKIILINTEEIFGYASLGSRKYNVNLGDIIFCCKGKLNSAGKHPETNNPLIWMYHDDWIKLSQEQKDNIFYKNSRHSKVVCITTNEIFEMIISGAKKYNINNRSITECCKGRRKSAGKHPVTREKLVWMYYEDWLKLNNK